MKDISAQIIQNNIKYSLPLIRISFFFYIKNTLKKKQIKIILGGPGRREFLGMKAPLGLVRLSN